MAFFAEKNPSEIDNLMLYARTVQKLLNPVVTKRPCGMIINLGAGGKRTLPLVHGNIKMLTFIRCLALNLNLRTRISSLVPQQSTNTVLRTTTTETVPKAMLAPTLTSANCVRENTTANYAQNFNPAQKEVPAT